MKQIGNKSLVIDVCLWLASRLHVLAKPTAVSRPAMFGQFGAGFAQMKPFKPSFSDVLRVALAAYPDARVGGSGLLHPGQPPIAKPNRAPWPLLIGTLPTKHDRHWRWISGAAALSEALRPFSSLGITATDAIQRQEDPRPPAFCRSPYRRKRGAGACSKPSPNRLAIFMLLKPARP